MCAVGMEKRYDEYRVIIGTCVEKAKLSCVLINSDAIIPFVETLNFDGSREKQHKENPESYSHLCNAIMNFMCILNVL